MATLTYKDIYLGLSGLEPGVDEIELGQGGRALLLTRFSRSYPSLMSSIVEIEELALHLPERERATLAAAFSTLFQVFSWMKMRASRKRSDAMRD